MDDKYPDGRYYTVGEYSDVPITVGHLAVCDEERGLMCIADAENATRIVSALEAQRLLAATIEDVRNDAHTDYLAALEFLLAKDED